jgi:hypothetical protein
VFQTTQAAASHAKSCTGNKRKRTNNDSPPTAQPFSVPFSEYVPNLSSTREQLPRLDWCGEQDPWRFRFYAIPGSLPINCCAIPVRVNTDAINSYVDAWAEQLHPSDHYFTVFCPAPDQFTVTQATVQRHAGFRLVVTFFHPEGKPLLVDTIYLRPPPLLPKAQAEDPDDPSSPPMDGSPFVGSADIHDDDDVKDEEEEEQRQPESSIRDSADDNETLGGRDQHLPVRVTAPWALPLAIPEPVAAAPEPVAVAPEPVAAAPEPQRRSDQRRFYYYSVLVETGFRIQNSSTTQLPSVPHSNIWVRFFSPDEHPFHSAQLVLIDTNNGVEEIVITIDADPLHSWSTKGKVVTDSGECVAMFQHSWCFPCPRTRTRQVLTARLVEPTSTTLLGPLSFISNTAQRPRMKELIWEACANDAQRALVSNYAAHPPRQRFYQNGKGLGFSSHQASLQGTFRASDFAKSIYVPNQ